MVIKITVIGIFALILSTAANGQNTPKPTPVLYLKNYALTTCISAGLQTEKAAEYAAAASREYFEHGALPIEAHTEATLLARKFLSKEYKNIYGENLVFIKCIDFYNSKELDQLARKYVTKK